MAFSKTYRLLVGCDDKEMVDNISKVLAEMGCDCDVSLTSAQTRQMLSSNNYDIILLHIDMDGFDICRGLTSGAEKSQVIMIGEMGGGKRKTAFEAGASSYMITPFSDAELRTKINRHLEIAEMKAELEHLRSVYEKMLQEQAELTEHLMLYNEQLQKEIDRRALLLSEETKRAYELSQRSVTLEDALHDKETLLKEVHHRVKNNMQIISSLLALQMNSFDDKKLINIFKDTAGRIRSMALVHEKLYQSSDISSLNVADYFNDLVADIMQSYELRSFKEVDVKLDIKVDRLNVDLMIPCGLIVSELVSNAVKYAFQDVPRGELFIGFRKNSEDKYELIVADNGNGLPPEEELKKRRSLGWQLVNDLVRRKIRGTLKIDRSRGTRFIITF